MYRKIIYIFFQATLYSIPNSPHFTLFISNCSNLVMVVSRQLQDGRRLQQVLMCLVFSSSQGSRKWNLYSKIISISFQAIHDGWRQLLPGWKSLEKSMKRSFASLPIHKLK